MYHQYQVDLMLFKVVDNTAPALKIVKNTAKQPCIKVEINNNPTSYQLYFPTILPIKIGNYQSKVVVTPLF